jgi:beta-lactam-binding protein with PASTA domain
MSLLKTSASALGKLLAAVVLAVAFAFGMGGVVYLSLRGEEVKVPEIVGKDAAESERELAALGLKLKKRASRYSEEKPNTILEQLPRAGDTVKTGQTILIVTAQANPEGTEAPATVKKEEEEVESVDANAEKPKTSNRNSNSGAKRPEKTRDVISNKANKNSNTANTNGGSSSSSSGSDSKSNSNNDGGSGGGNNRNSSTPGGANKPSPANPGKTPATTTKPAAKPAAATDGGDTRSRRAPQN